MKVALRELRRRPWRFLPVGGALTLLVVLLVVLGGFLDGLTLVQTGAYRAHEGRVLVFADDAELQLARSRVPAALRDEVAGVDGVAAVGGLATVQATAAVAAEGSGSALEDVVVFGYEQATDVLPAPPPPGEAVVASALADVTDVEAGDTVALGPQAVEVEVTTFVDDVTQGAPTVWVPLVTWREVVATAAPAQALPEGVVSALVVEPAGDLDAAALASRLDAEVGGIDAATVTTAIDALPVVAQQAATFQGIIVVTFVVTLLVVALFFVLLTIERVRLYAVLKAVGARSRDLLAGVSVQAIVVAGGAVILGTLAAFLFALALPAELPVRLVPARLAQIAGGTLLTALLGSLVTLRRITAVDPAEAIG